MVAPSTAVRRAVLTRDGVCVAGVGERGRLEFQHRQAVGMGGSRRRPGVVDGLAACPVHNARFESDLQVAALVCGWKVQRWVDDVAVVPVFYREDGVWAVLDADGGRGIVSARRALTLMRAVYGAETYAGWLEVLGVDAPDFGGKNTCEWSSV